MNGKHLTITIGLTLIFSVNVIFAQGRHVDVILYDGHQTNGELISVRDSALILLSDDARSDEHSTDSISPFAVIRVRDIRTLTVKGTSEFGRWIGIGSVVGAVSGAVIGSEIAIFDHGYGAALGGLIGAGGGILVGSIVASGARGKDAMFNPFAPEDLSSLKPFSRYPENESEYIRQLK